MKKQQNLFFDLFKECPIPDNELLLNLGLFIKRQDLSRLLYLDYLYRKIINVHGIVMEFGTRWGQNLALFSSFRGMYEPFNHNRKVVGFDTFKGFPSIHKKDGKSDATSVGAYTTTKKYEKYLKKILDCHEQESPLSSIKKHEVIKGDASLQINKFLKDNPETIIALAYFDLDLYEPTKKCLEAIKKHLTKGSVIGFDELNVGCFPGETLALKEVFGLDKYKITRSPYNPLQSFVVIE
ncbi:crotonobetainyl-CoA--carnitine CoA-transferase [Candidatus Beckwithbacteria bacterium CG10_big_fil_rev_8_21_14_0_10_34_10]|uniref:Crotonobetainyl-CoA--carnitine CoA-transferase n=1 Tax=Candidatus Beckwithbacteria bacterium CG10_big_fil_rev_8_21_14_0_10_34_10 TaxID=1974495 RepID=A0A2H0W9K3_9BACT|nr:MAG: crotonobetainyl-CoA--carnitine CoA-transferase [Candidatus Beckwithbacteria bacterium CG10_big_fil_rev_8_21_14_0_10_34_10]